MSRYTRYTAAQKEILCNLDVGEDQNTLAWQNKMAAKLADQIENDPENTLYNANKLNQYREKASLEPVEDSSYFSTENAQTALSWFTSIRLFIVRLNGLLKATGLGFLAKWFDFLGLSYLAELVVALIDIGWTTFQPLRPAEKQLIENDKASRAQIYWWRFKNKMTQDEDLIPNMLNAAVWFSLNLTAFILTGGFSAVAVAPAVKLLVNRLNIGGFIFDALHEAGKGIADFWRHSQTLNVVQEELEHLNKKRNDLQTQLKEYQNKDHVNTHYESNNEYVKLRKKCDIVESKIKSRLVLKKKLEEKIDWTIIPTRLYNWGVASVLSFATGIADGFGIVCTLASKAVSLVAGSVVGGFGKRIWSKVGAPLWNKAKQALSSSTEEERVDSALIKAEKVRINNTDNLIIIEPKEIAINNPEEIVPASPTQPIPIPRYKNNLFQGTHRRIHQLTNQSAHFVEINKHSNDPIEKPVQRRIESYPSGLQLKLSYQSPIFHMSPQLTERCGDSYRHSSIGTKESSLPDFSPLVSV